MKDRATRMEMHYGNRLFRCYAERPDTVRTFLRHALEAGADRPAVSDGETTLTYHELDAAAARAAGGLAGLGVARGDRVAAIVDNRIEFLVVALACAKLAAIFVPMGLRLRAPEIAYICANSGARVLIHEADLAPHLPDKSELPAVMARISVAGSTEGSIPFADIAGSAPLDKAPELCEDDPFCIFYTSGTTGKPKGAIITHLGIVHSSLHWEIHLELTQGISAVLAIPGSHIAGFAGVVMPVLHLQGHLHLMRNFKAAALLDMMERERIEHALLVPAMYNLCLLDSGFAKRDLSAWKWAVYGGAPMTEATIRKFREVLPALRMANAYGATETTSPATIMVPERTLDKSVSIGKHVECGDIRIIGEDGREVAAGETGELLIAGPMITPGYWDNPQATEKSFASGYWKSGDVGSVDEEGFISLFDRKKDMIIRAGFKVFSAEVENALSDLDGVLDVAVIGMPDPVLGERVAAFLQTGPDQLTARDVHDFCRVRMADYKIPERIELQTEPLPRNANGKLQKDLLRERLT